jgi:hypothetical protein
MSNTIGARFAFEKCNAGEVVPCTNGEIILRHNNGTALK